MRAEPKSIVNFLSNHFEFLRELFETEVKEQLIRKEKFDRIASRHHADILQQLLEYKILRKVNEDFELHSVYRNLLEFILNEFRPLLPETIEKYRHSIDGLFSKVRDWSNGDRIILGHAMSDLSGEIKSFYETVEKNTLALLKETRDLKSNLTRIDYREKVLRASRWIDDYILPLNQVLDVNHKDSITQRLYSIGQYLNKKRLSTVEESLQQTFEKLYQQIQQTHDNLLVQSRILTNELLPLIERLRTESLILSGFIEFLKNPYKVQPPPLIKSFRATTIASSMYLNATEYTEQFLNQEEVIIDVQSKETERWIFNKAEYKEKLITDLPVESFFNWCEKRLNIDFQETDPQKFFALSILLFDQDFSVKFSDKSEKESVQLNKLKLTVPKMGIQVKQDELFQTPPSNN